LNFRKLAARAMAGRPQPRAAPQESGTTMTKRRHHETEPTPAEPAQAAANGAPVDDGPAEGYPDAPDVVVDDMGAEAGELPAAVEADVPSVEDVLRRERDEAQEKWLRVLAELDNVRKRSRREVVDARRFAQADVLRGFLDILDNLERALQTNGTAADTGAPDPLRAGIELTRQKFRSVLQEQGVTPIEALGLHLDPLVHEAVGQLPREGSEPGTIIEVAQAGYRLGELVLRPARVIICA
jgi:molecular chaperone GrpE